MSSISTIANHPGPVIAAPAAKATRANAIPLCGGTDSVHFGSAAPASKPSRRKELFADGGSRLVKATLYSLGGSTILGASALAATANIPVLPYVGIAAGIGLGLYAAYQGLRAKINLFRGCFAGD